MEAVAKYSYTASSPSELSFNAGDTMKVNQFKTLKIIFFKHFSLLDVFFFDLKIIPYDEFWCRGRINGKDGYVPKSYITEKPHP